MRSTIRLGLQALLQHPWLLIVLGINTALPLMCALLIGGYQTDMRNRYETVNPSLLVIQENGSMGEFYGSRIPVKTAELLRARGYADPIAEIHAVTGATPGSAVLLRGVDPARYQEIERFRIMGGRPLSASDPTRATMIGAQLARVREAGVGGPIQIRGREFVVVGIFETGAVTDFEAWTSLRDAQDLLGWGNDVSLFVVPADGPLKSGDPLPGGLAAVERGASGRNLAREWGPLFDLLNAIAVSLGVWSALALAATLGRLAWLRRRDLGVMRVVGYTPGALAAHVAAQGLAVAALATMLAFAGASAVGALNPLQTSGVQVRMVLDVRTVAFVLACGLGIGLAGSVVPAVWLARMPLAGLVRADWA